MPQTPPPAKYHALRSNWVQSLCPQPKRHLQRLILKYNLKTGLDIGCGVASPLTALHPFGFHSTGIDISPEEVEKSRIAKAHDDYIVGDFRTMDLGKKFDVVVLSHVIEHFNREDGLAVLQRIESLAARMVYVETPHGFIEQTAFDGSIFQRHLSGWFPHDFQSRCYTVFGSGIKRWAGSGSKPPAIPPAILHPLSRMSQWYIFRRPHLGAAIGAVKYTDENGDIREI